MQFKHILSSRVSIFILSGFKTNSLYFSIWYVLQLLSSHLNQTLQVRLGVIRGQIKGYGSALDMGLGIGLRGPFKECRL